MRDLRELIVRTPEVNEIADVIKITETLSVTASKSFSKRAAEMRYAHTGQREFSEQVNNYLFNELVEQLQPWAVFEQAFNDCLNQAVDCVQHGASPVPAILALKKKLDYREFSK